MALTETLRTAQDIRGEYCSINEITDTIILRDDVEISSARHRSGPVNAGSIVEDVYVQTTTTQYSTAFQNIANALWTDELHTAYEASLRS